MARFRDSRGRFITANKWFAWYGRPRDSLGRFKRIVVPRSKAEQEHLRRSVAASIGWETRRANEAKRRRSEAARRGWETRRARDTVPAGPTLSERQDYFGVQDVPKSEVDSGTRIKASIDLGAGPVYEYDGPPDEFDVREMKRALDEWSEEALGDESHYWRAPGSRIFKVDRYERADKSAWDRIEITARPETTHLVKSAIAAGSSEPSEPPPPAVGRSLPADQAPPELTDDDALPI